MIPTSNMICVYRYRKSCDSIREVGSIIVTCNKRIVLGIILVIRLKFHKLSLFIGETPIRRWRWNIIIFDYSPCLSCIIGGKNFIRCHKIHVIEVSGSRVIQQFSHPRHGLWINYPIIIIISSKNFNIGAMVSKPIKIVSISHNIIFIPSALNNKLTWFSADEKLLGRLSK